MKYCSKCGEQLDEANKYCPGCGAAQNKEESEPHLRDQKLPAIVITLAILTLLGSAFGIIRGMFYQTFASLFESTSLYNEGYARGYILVFLNLGTLIAAILMLNLKRMGYYLYLLFQSAYLVFTFYILLIYSSADTLSINDGFNPIILLLGSVFWLPSSIMILLYLTLARRYFTGNPLSK